MKVIKVTIELEDGAYRYMTFNSWNDACVWITHFVDEMSVKPKKVIIEIER